MKEFHGHARVRNKSAVSAILKSSVLLLLGFFFLILSACSECCAGVNPLHIQSFQPLQEIQGHYATLSTFNRSPVTENKAMDAIKFPSTSNVLLTKIIRPAYLTRAELTEMRKTLRPPANSSEQTREELDFLLDLQNSRTPQQVAEALRIHDIVYFPIIGFNDEKDLFFEVTEIFGADFPIAKYPKTQKLLNKLMKEMRIMEFDVKNHILRARPRQLESNLQPLKKMGSSSFASGHTLWAYLQD